MSQESKRFFWVILSVLMLVLVTGLIPVQPVLAQQNLLQDPSFEVTGTYKRVATDALDNTTYFDVPQAWGGWVIQPIPGDPEWKNRVPTGFPHTGLFKFDGGQSLHISRGYATFTTAVYQTVTVPDKANLRGSARGFMERGEPKAGGSFKVGIDPNGGTNPLAAGVIWSSEATTAGGWVQVSVDATAVATSVTLFLYSTQSQPADPNGIYWDDASLSVGGSGAVGTPGATNAPPVPTPPPFASFVVPQAPQDDGSIIHTVQEGDTFAAIAVAYKTTMDEIMALNGMSVPPRFLQIGQKLLIRRAPPPGGLSSADIAAQQATVEPVTTEEIAITEEVTATEEVEVTETQEVIATEEITATEEVSVPATVTPTPQPPTSTDAPPAPVTQVAQANAAAATTGVCLTMFDDVNQNRIREEGEALLANGTITLSTEGATVETYTTDGASEPFCLPDLKAGTYTAAAQAPEGYGLTTAAQLSLRVQSGFSINASFGAAQGVQAVVPPAADSGDEAPQAIAEETANDNKSILLQNIGLIVFGLAAFVLVFGLGAALVLRRR